MYRRLKNSQRGDTIMEVLICIAILSLILGAAYALSSRSQIANLQAQERGVASQFVDSQIELLRAYVDKQGQLPTPDYFCLKVDSATGNEVPVDIPNTAAIPADCQRDPFYSVVIYSPDKAKDELNGAGDSFGILVKWDAASGNGNDQVKLFYKVNPTVSTAFESVASPPPPPPPAPPAPPPPPPPPPAPVSPSEELSRPPSQRPVQYGRLCNKLDNRGSTVYYYSLNGELCAGGGTFMYNSNADRSSYNRACLMPDGRYAYGPTTATLYCPQGGVLQ